MLLFASNCKITFLALQVVDLPVFSWGRTSKFPWVQKKCFARCICACVVRDMKKMFRSRNMCVCCAELQITVGHRN